MAVNRLLPFYSFSNDELERHTNSDTIHINYLYINYLDQMILNPLDLEQYKNSNGID